jgi:hypothetical protein
MSSASVEKSVSGLCKYRCKTEAAIVAQMVKEVA